MRFYIIMLFSFSAFAQGFERGYVAADIHFKEVNVLSGYIYDDFAQNNNYGKPDSNSGNVSFNVGGQMNMGTGPVKSSTFQTIIKTIHYKKGKDDSQQADYSASDIDFITVNRNGTIAKYKTLKVKRVENENGVIRIDTLKREIWAPVLKEGGKIDVYGYLIWEAGEKYYWGEVYFKRADEEYAINLIKSHKKVFGLGSQKEDIAFGIKDIFKDCPAAADDCKKLAEEYIDDMKSDRGFTPDEKKLIKSLSAKEEQAMMRFELREKILYRITSCWKSITKPVIKKGKRTH